MSVLHTQACKRSSQACHQPQQGSQSESASGEGRRGEYISFHVFYLPGRLPWSCPFPIHGRSAPSMGVRPNCGYLSSPPKEREHNCTHPVYIHAAFTRRIYGFRDCPGKSVLSPTTQMRKLRGTGHQQQGSTSADAPETSSQALLPKPAAHWCSCQLPASPTLTLTLDCPGLLICALATTSCYVKQPGSLRWRFFSSHQASRTQSSPLFSTMQQVGMGSTRVNMAIGNNCSTLCADHRLPSNLALCCTGS